MTENHPFGFPFGPYDIQIEFMQKLYSTVESGKVGLFSSPTGTGKSLSLLCGSLHWLMEYRRKLKEGIEDEEKVVLHKNILERLENEPDWVKQYALKKADTEHQRKLKREALESARSRKKPKFYLNPEINIRLQKLVDIDDSDLSETDVIGHDRQLQPIQIVYASRTHSQLSQMIGELKRTVYAKYFKVRSVSLGSRKQLCINKEVLKLDSLNAINEKCKESSCEYRKKGYDSIIDQSLQQVHDLEDFVKVGQDCGECPYYGSHEMLPYCEIVTVPYSILLSKNTRESVNLNLANSIVIIDEAHNLVDAISNIHSVILSASSVQLASDILKQYLSKYLAQLSGDNTVMIKIITQILKKIAQNFKREESNMFDVQDFIFASKLDSFNLFEVIQFIQDYRLCQKSMGIFKELAKNVSEHSCKTSPLYDLVSFLQMISMNDTQGKIFLLVDKSEEIPSKCLKYLLLDPSEPFRPIVEEAKSVILAGGTMEPIDEFISYLLPYVPKDRIETFNCNHVIDDSQLSVLVVQEGVSGQPFEFKFTSRNDLKLMNDLGESILELSRLVPSGLVVFFPSFNFLDGALGAWRQNQLLPKLTGSKRIYTEPRNNREVEDVLEKYAAEIRQNSNGAMMFCVVGGKLSEGINFSDDLARGICVVGLPYANPHDPELRKKMEYLDQNAKENNQTFDGTEYYENLCMKSVNQTVGRAIRHKNDYAIIYLLDRRYVKPKIQAKLPNWMKPSVEICPNFTAAKTTTKVFFKDKSNR